MLDVGDKHSLDNHNLSGGGRGVEKKADRSCEVRVPAAGCMLEGGLHLVPPRRDSHDLPAPAQG